MTVSVIGIGAILERDVGFFRRLERGQQGRLMVAIERFIDSKPILGAGGFTVDERVRVLVAASACRLALNLVAERYHRLEWVHVMPAAFDHRTGLCDGTAQGCYSISLAFDELESGLREHGNGNNVGYHEFAHVLDASDGIMDGIPPLLLAPQLRTRWRAVLARNLSRLRFAIDASIPTVLPAEAAHDEAELFAYATEQFFERPQPFCNAHPDLYALLQSYYKQDPLREFGE
jgi:hypothetical protein